MPPLLLLLLPYYAITPILLRYYAMPIRFSLFSLFACCHAIIAVAAARYARRLAE